MEDSTRKLQNIAPVFEPPALPFEAPLPTSLVGLRGKIIMFAVMLAILPLLVSSISMITNTRDELKSSVNGNLLTTTDDVMGEVRLTVEPALQTLSLLQSAVDSPVLSVDDKVVLLHGAIENLHGLVVMELVVDGRPPVYLFTQAFKARLDEAGLSPEQAIPTPATFASGQADAGSITLGKPLFLASPEAWLLPLWVSLREPVAGMPARLVAYLDLGGLQRNLEVHPFWQSGSLRLADEQGAPIFAELTRPSIPWPVESAADPGTADQGAVIVTPYRLSDGTKMVGAVGTMTFPPWRVVVALPEHRAYAIVSRMQTHLALWLALGFAAAVIGALLLAHGISQPIREMAFVAQQVGYGNFQLQVRQRMRRDEIGILGNRLNLMIRSLSESHRCLYQLAHYDTLTGLPNRQSVAEGLGPALSDAKQGGERIALLFLGLDGLKNVNDSLGRAVGDQLLKLVAQRLSERLGDEAIAASLNGPEFLILLKGVDDRRAVSAMAMKVIEAFRAPFRLMAYEIYVGVAIGISMAPENGAELTELINSANMAMYHARRQGRGHYRFFDDKLKAKAIRQLTLDGRLRRALERGELEVFYQPKVLVDSGQTVGMEALVRWPDKQGGFVASPVEFIPLAEETGLVEPLGEWVMETTCRQTRAWHQAGLPRVAVAVNVSARQFRHQDFFKRVHHTLEQSGLPGECLELELTERLLLEETGQAIKWIGSFKELGIKISIDDFGTGYSSLAYLRRFPLDYLKVPREFVHGIETNHSDAMITSAIIALAKSLGLKVIAEGVENSNELSFLSQRGCDLIQGYYFSRPLPSDQFEALLIRGGIIDRPRTPLICDGVC